VKFTCSNERHRSAVGAAIRSSTRTRRSRFSRTWLLTADESGIQSAGDDLELTLGTIVLFSAEISEKRRRHRPGQVILGVLGNLPAGLLELTARRPGVDQSRTLELRFSGAPAG